MVITCYQVYHKLANDESDRFVVAGCRAHTKRKFTEIIKGAGKSKNSSYSIASKAEKRIQKIHHEDNKLKEMSLEKKTKARQEKIKTVIDEFFTYIKTIDDTNILTKESATGKAITYALNQEEFLRVFLNDERLPMDNNEAERTGSWLIQNQEQKPMQQSTVL